LLGIFSFSLPPFHLPLMPQDSLSYTFVSHHYHYHHHFRSRFCKWEHVIYGLCISYHNNEPIWISLGNISILRPRPLLLLQSPLCHNIPVTYSQLPQILAWTSLEYHLAHYSFYSIHSPKELINGAA
jgi:hypothetical protein